MIAIMRREEPVTTATAMDRPTCSTEEAAARLGVERRTVVRLLDSGVLRGYRDGPRTKRRVFVDSVDEVWRARASQAKGS